MAVPGSGSVDGAFQSEVSAFFESVIEGSVPGRMTGIRRVPFNARLVHITPTGGASASWVAEGEGKPLSSVALSAQPLRAKKVVAMAVFSDELLSAAETIFRVQSAIRYRAHFSMALVMMQRPRQSLMAWSP